MMNVIAMIIVVGVLLYVFIYEFIIPVLKEHEKNKKWIQQNGKKLKKLCIECEYSIKKKYHPFPYGEYRNAMVQDIPTYCKKFKKQLNCKYNCRCISKGFSKAFYEENNKI